MKKTLIGILVGILIAGVIVGAGFGIDAAVKAKQAAADKAGIHRSCDPLIEDEYKTGDNIAVHFAYQDDKQFTAIKYRIDSGDETALEATTGETKDNKKLNAKYGAYYVDTGVKTISTTGLKVGTHVLEVVAYQGETSVIVDTYIIKIIA